MAEGEPGTGTAESGEAFLFLFPEGLLQVTVHERGERCVRQAADPVIFAYKMIAGEDASVLFDNRGVPAGFPEPAETGFSAGKHSGGFAEQLHLRFVQVMIEPFSENIFQEFAVCAGRDREPGDGSVRFLDDNRNKLNPSGAEIQQGTVNQTAVCGGPGVHGAQEIRLDAVVLQEPDAVPDPVIGGMA